MGAKSSGSRHSATRQIAWRSSGRCDSQELDTYRAAEHFQAASVALARDPAKFRVRFPRSFRVSVRTPNVSRGEASGGRAGQTSPAISIRFKIRAEAVGVINTLFCIMHDGGAAERAPFGSSTFVIQLVRLCRGLAVVYGIRRLLPDGTFKR